MAIDLSEPLIPLIQVPAQPFVPRRRGGKKLNISTVFRWATTGVRGVKLEVIRFGGTLCTCRTALLEFFRALTPDIGAPSTPTPSRTLRQRERAAARAAKEVEAILRAKP